jgi:hypothetical protein
MRALVVLLLLSAIGCDERPRPEGSSSARPSASLAAPPSLAPSGSASATSGWPGAETTLHQLLAPASVVRVSEIAHDGTRVEVRSGMLKDPKDIDALLMALGKDQVPASGCVRCMPSVTLNFEDGRGTRIAAVGLFCDEGTAASTATLRDGSGNHCHLLTLGDSGTTRFLIKRSTAVAASASASASAAPAAAPDAGAAARPTSKP